MSEKGILSEIREKQRHSKKWKCKQCGKCCTFIVIPVAEVVTAEVRAYLHAHGIKVSDNKLIIPARCKFLSDTNKCKIEPVKFSNCKAGGEKECRDAQKQWSSLIRK